MELDSGEKTILQGDVVLQAYFVIKGRIEAYVHEEQPTGNNDSSGSGSRASWGDPGSGADATPPLRQSSYLGVWGPTSMWGLSNIMLGGNSEVRWVGRCPYARGKSESAFGLGWRRRYGRSALHQTKHGGRH